MYWVTLGVVRGILILVFLWAVGMDTSSLQWLIAFFAMAAIMATGDAFKGGSDASN